MDNWYALTSGGDIVGLGQHKDFNEACERADATHPGQRVWVVDAEGARDWYISLTILLRDTGELPEGLV